MTQSTLRGEVELFGSAAAAAVLGTAICYDARPGLNWTLWTVLAAGELTFFARPRLGANRSAFDVTIAFAVILGAGAAVTANPAAIALIFVTVATLLGVAARLAAGTPAPLFGVRELARMPFRATIDAIRESYARVESAARSAFSDAGAHVVRGLAIALPILVVFTALLAGADPTLSSWLHALTTLLSDWSWFPRFVFFCVLGTISLGSFGLAIGGSISPAPAVTTSGPRWSSAQPRSVQPTSRAERSEASTCGGAALGDTERRIVVGAVDALFALFLVLVAFDSLPQGQSYTEYVHNGFAQLTIVATLTVMLVAALHNGRPRVGIPWGTLALLGECELLVASALHRIAVYQRDYGYTALRIWVTAYMLLAAGLLVLVAYEVARPRLVDARRFVRRGALVSLATLTAMVYGNPDAWVASLELHRYRATGKADVDAMADLSADAAPTLIALANALPASCTSRLRFPHRTSRRWYEWSARDARAQRALEEFSPARSVGNCPVAPW